MRIPLTVMISGFLLTFLVGPLVHGLPAGTFGSVESPVVALFTVIGGAVISAVGIDRTLLADIAREARLEAAN